MTPQQRTQSEFPRSFASAAPGAFGFEKEIAGSSGRKPRPATLTDQQTMILSSRGAERKQLVIRDRLIASRRRARIVERVSRPVRDGTHGTKATDDVQN